MSARSPRPTYPVRTTATCTCAVAKHPKAAEIDAELRLVGTTDRPDAPTLISLAAHYGLPVTQQLLSRHRSLHLGLPRLPNARPRINPPRAELPPVPRRRTTPQPRTVAPPQLVARQEPPPLPQTPEGTFAQLVKTVATLVALGSYRGLQTVRALAARHSVPESEVLRAHRRAAQTVRDGRGGLREQLELSVGVLTQIRDQERQVAEDYTGVAERIVAPALPNRQTGAPAQRLAGLDELERARLARSIAAQAQDNAVAAQKQIDQNTIHRRTAPLVQVSFSASQDFARAQEGLVLLMCAIVGQEREQEARERVARGLQVLEDAGEDLDAPEFLEYLAELRADSGALTVDAAE